MYNSTLQVVKHRASPMRTGSARTGLVDETEDGWWKGLPVFR